MIRYMKTGVFLLVALMLILSGCQTENPIPLIDSARANVNAIGIKAVEIDTAAQTITGNDSTKQTIITLAGGIKSTADATETMLKTATTQAGATQKKLDKTLNNPWVKFGLWLQGFVYTLLTFAFVIALVVFLGSGPVTSLAGIAAFIVKICHPLGMVAALGSKLSRGAESGK